MTYIKSQIEKEKTKYWNNVKSLAIVTSIMSICTVVMLYLGYLFYNYKNIMSKYTTIAFLIVIISLGFSTIIYRTYKYWHMIYKRHRIGYYSLFMNYLIMTIFTTSVTITILIFMNNYIKVHNFDVIVIITILCIVIITTCSIIKFRKKKPSLPLITEQEKQDREYLKSLYYYILRTRGLDNIELSTQIGELNYLGALDCYINYDVYDAKQVEKWRHNLYYENITVNQIFKEMSELNHTKATEIYHDVYEKSKRKIRELNKYFMIRNQYIYFESQVKLYFQEYLD